MKLACTAHATFARMALTPPRVFTVDFPQKPAYRLPDLDASPLNHVLRQEGAKGHGSTAFHDWHFFLTSSCTYMNILYNKCLPPSGKKSHAEYQLIFSTILFHFYFIPFFFLQFEKKICLITETSK